MLEKLWGCLHLPWYPHHRRHLVRKPTPRTAVCFELKDQVQHLPQTDRPAVVKHEPQFAEGSYKDSAHKNSHPTTSIHITRSPSTQWDITSSSIIVTAAENLTSVKLKRLWVSVDERSFLGSVAVANYAFEKSVICRFTFNHWHTISEIHAQYAYSLTGTNPPNEVDYFLFTLKLPDEVLVQPGIKTFQCCIKYIVNGQGYWDNNHGLDYRVSFKRKEPCKN
ncbi:hypothetical protein FGSG_11641 [Fusarium graminearum PH-1]|uniref:Chromosome 1, complete genome n=1 Tax=Gibberella zeae (strain ATCC MYA-4620 / CBS 123657 / FGSC 9075 / NRRL 31084 / PH-1) TaxID=229533 RepID=I1S474_GIBZE|nr:hypothetical protein FGSG_11641 [Fusarium graminearum PH-1]ESU05088.1 hypothetical protein FGSG_11641 [Fusarium graminearum PH-1]CEF71811.1 unnamed protein product [Fusarium graminearum]|eukprot:XP_011315573.1 hypothetical protein FGSG_11641 [Fusarium graminearum PH-1]